MKFSYWIAALSIMGLFAAAVPAHAAAPATNAPKWTQQDVTTLCQHRFPKNEKRAQTCMKRNARRIGKPMVGPAAQELKTGVRPHRKGRRAAQAAQ